MKPISKFYAGMSVFLVVVLIILSNVAMAQVDTTKPKMDTAAAMPAQTTTPPVQTTTPPPPASSGGKEGKPRKFSVYAGPNSNTMSGSTDKYNANAGVGWHLGVAWSRPGFIYWQFGLRYNNAVYGFNSKATSVDTGDLKVQALDIPVTLGVNILSFAKIAALRGFVSAIPSFNLGVSDNHFGVTKDDINSFIFYGQLGIGVDVAFTFLDIGYNYGTSSLMKNSTSSTNPGQWFLSLGIRF